MRVYDLILEYYGAIFSNCIRSEGIRRYNKLHLYARLLTLRCVIVLMCEWKWGRERVKTRVANIIIAGGVVFQRNATCRNILTVFHGARKNCFIKGNNRFSMRSWLLIGSNGSSHPRVHGIRGHFGKFRRFGGQLIINSVMLSIRRWKFIIPLIAYTEQQAVLSSTPANVDNIIRGVSADNYVAQLFT